jgi:two-component system phosphate regulon sensor histidine kinase PhoR
VRKVRFRNTSIRLPVTLLVVLLVLVVTLTVLWNVVLVHDYNRLKEIAGGAFHTTFLVLGSALCLSITVLATILGIRLISNVRWSQRQSNFLASVSHELNSPLSSIKLFAQTLRREGLDPADRARFTGKILADTERLSRIVANIVRAAEVDHRGEPLVVAPAEVDLMAYLRAFVDDARAVHASDLDLSLEGEDACVEIDPMMFRQVLDNLIDNSIRYRTKTPAPVRIKVKRDDGWTEIQVTDEGTGVPPDRIERIFDRFRRLEDGQRPAGRRGMGIGLSIVRSIVQSHGGVVGAWSDGPGRGLTTWIRLPEIRRAEVPA